MNLGLIARADEGGLGTQTLEFARHMDVDSIMVVHVVPERGHYDPQRYAGLADWIGVVEYPGGGNRKLWADFTRRVDVVYAAETAYSTTLATSMLRTRKRLIIHANPEFHRATRTLFELWAPSTWRIDQFPPNTPHVPYPVDRDRCQGRQASFWPVRDVLHVSSPATHDRNGTRLLRASLEYVRHPFTLHVVGPDAPLEAEQVGVVRVVGRRDERDYWRIYEGMDALILPRRFGGLCLPMQEAASCGLPIVTLDTEPQSAWTIRELAAPASVTEKLATQGGDLDVYSAGPAMLAERINRLANEDVVRNAIAHSNAWADSISWERMRPRYDARIGRGELPSSVQTGERRPGGSSSSPRAPRRVHKAAFLVPLSLDADDEWRTRNWHIVFNRLNDAWPLADVRVGECDGPWCKATAINDAFARTDADVLVIHDADVFVSRNALADALMVVGSGEAPWAMPHGMVYRLDATGTRYFYDHGTPKERHLARSPYRAVPGGGLIVVSRDVYLDVGGFDPRFVGWGGEDEAFGLALKTLHGDGWHASGERLWHLWHDPAAPGARRPFGDNAALLARYREATTPEAMRTLISERS